MRSFWSAACFFALLGAACFFMDGDFVSFHQSAFLSLVPAAAYCVFLITAIPDWVSYKNDLRRVFWALFAIIAVALIAAFFEARAASAVLAVFWLALFSFVAYMVWWGRNDNNFSILGVLALFATLQGAFALSGDATYLRAQIHVHAAAVSIVSFRVSVALGVEALKSSNLKDPVFIPNAVFKNLAATFVLLYAFADLFVGGAVSAFVAVGAGLVILAGLRELHYFALWTPYFALYYAFRLLGGLGYLWLGAAGILGLATSPALHLIALCYMLGVILFIFVVAGLRHSGFSDLRFGALGVGVLLAIFGAGILRAVLAGRAETLYIHVPAALLGLAFVLYLVKFLPIFLSRPFSDDPD